MKPDSTWKTKRMYYPEPSGVCDVRIFCCANAHTVFFVELNHKTLGEWKALVMEKAILTRFHDFSCGMYILPST